VRYQIRGTEQEIQKSKKCRSGAHDGVVERERESKAQWSGRAGAREQGTAERQSGSGRAMHNGAAERERESDAQWSGRARAGEQGTAERQSGSGRAMHNGAAERERESGAEEPRQSRARERRTSPRTKKILRWNQVEHRDRLHRNNLAKCFLL